MIARLRDTVPAFIISLLSLLVALGVLYAVHRWIWLQSNPLTPEPVEVFLRETLGWF